LAVEDIGRNAADTESGGVTLRCDHPVLALAQHQRRPSFPLGKAALDAEPHQFVDLADIDSLLKISLHDAVLDLRLQAMPCRMGNQQMRAAGVRHAFDQIEAEVQPDRRPMVHESLFHCRNPRRVAELGREELRPLDPFPG
jgi:hypothetical protein